MYNSVLRTLLVCIIVCFVHIFQLHTSLLDARRIAMHYSILQDARSTASVHGSKML